MKKKKAKKLLFISKLLLFIVFMAGFFMIMSDRFKIYTNLTYDIGKNRSVPAVHLVSKYVPEVTEVKVASTFNEVLQYAASNPVQFMGTMTGYGPDCEGCTGLVSCPPRQNVRNGNIYFEDSEYGKTRILAGDKSIPCGTIIEVSGINNYNNFYGIVLDRGGVIKGTLFDLLFPSERESSPFGRVKASYKIVRWGW